MNNVSIKNYKLPIVNHQDELFYKRVNDIILWVAYGLLLLFMSLMMIKLTEVHHTDEVDKTVLIKGTKVTSSITEGLDKYAISDFEVID